MKKEYTSDLVYNKIVQSYGFNIAGSLSSQLKYDLLKKYSKLDYSVLDAGCANGLFCFAASLFTKEVTGIDINKKFLKLAEEKKQELNTNNISFNYGDLEKIPFNDKTFDITYSYSTLLLVENFEKALKECIRTTKSNGFLILDITGKYNLSQWFWKKYYASNGHFHFNAFLLSETKKLFKNNNLNILEIHALGFLDQWKYLPVISRFASKLSFIDKLIHHPKFDLDYFISNLSLFKPLANRWYIVCQKK